jgi:hypothetical protein
VITADCCEPRFVTVAVKDPLVCPTSMFTLDGVATPLLLLVMATTAPPPGAGALRTTAQTASPGTGMEAVEHVSVTGCAATVNAITADRIAPLRDAVTVAFCAL